MPEGPEVKLSAESIKSWVQNKYVANILLGTTSRYRDKIPEGYDKFNNSYRELTDIGVSLLKILDIKTRGKFMYWEFAQARISQGDSRIGASDSSLHDNGWYMFCTFGMSGQWSLNSGKHVCLDIKLLDEKWLRNHIYFNDPRHFGTIKFTNNKQDLFDKLGELGWDPFQDKLDEYFPFIINKLSKTNKPIGQVMMDQRIFAGVGNYIRAEILYLAKMSPWRPANLLSRDEIDILCQACILIMEESYKYQGATIQTYKTAYGEKGGYANFFKVYGRQKDILDNEVIKENTPDGRTIHWCPKVQK